MSRRHLSRRAVLRGLGVYIALPWLDATGPFQPLAEAAADAHLQAHGMLTAVTQPVGGAVPQIASPLKLSGSPDPRLEPSPEYGEHTEAVLREAGYDDAALADLRAQKVIE